MTQNEACLLSCEDEQEFAEFRRGLDEAHQPANMHEHFLVEEFAQAAWELRRVRRIDREFWQYVGGHYNRGETGIAEALAQEKESKFRIHLRLRAQVERSYYRALDALERMRRNRDRAARQLTTAPADRPTDPHAGEACTATPLACTAPQSSAPEPQSSPRPALPASAASALAARPTPHLQVVPPRTPTVAEPLADNEPPHATPLSVRPRGPTETNSQLAAEPERPNHLDTIRYCPSRGTA